jgi:cytidylate kinase
VAVTNLACQVVTISRCLGAGGEEIARAVAQELGFRYTDEEIIARAAREAGVSPKLVAEAEHTPGLITRILENMARTPLASEGWSGAAMMPANTKTDYASLIARIVREVANEGDVVIVAHGASIPLASMGGLLRVFVTGSEGVRAERVAIETELDASEARKVIAESDRQRRDYLRRFYDVPQELPTHYDLVLNTDALALPLAVQLIVSAAKGE